MHIHKQELKNNPILICLVCFLVGPQDLASLCKPWDHLWTWTLGQHTACFTTSFYIYISGIVKPTFSWVYQTVNKSHVLISTIHLYQQPIISQANIVGFIRPSTITHALISTIKDHFQVSFLVVSFNSTTPYHTRDHSHI